MTELLLKRKRTVNTLIVGGRSGVARAMRRLYPDTYDFVVRSKQSSTHPTGSTDDQCSTTDRTIGSYENLSADDMRGYSTVINLAGISQGTPEQLMAVNSALPLHLATEAARAGVTHFIALSSFSVYGFANSISSNMPVNPENAYGRSRVAGELSIARYAGTMACTIARCPMLYGSGRSKLERLIALWCFIGALPAPALPVCRSMAHYDLAARYLREVASLNIQKPGLCINHFSDPTPFEYQMAARIISSATGRNNTVFTLPSASLRLFAMIFPQLSRSLYSDSVLDAQDNFFKDPKDSRLVSDLAAMASAGRNVA